MNTYKINFIYNFLDYGYSRDIGYSAIDQEMSVASQIYQLSSCYAQLVFWKSKQVYLTDVLGALVNKVHVFFFNSSNVC